MTTPKEYARKKIIEKYGSRISLKRYDEEIDIALREQAKEIREWIKYNECYCGKGDPLLFKFDKKFLKRDDEE